MGEEQERLELEYVRSSMYLFSFSPALMVTPALMDYFWCLFEIKEGV